MSLALAVCGDLYLAALVFDIRQEILYCLVGRIPQMGSIILTEASKKSVLGSAEEFPLLFGEDVGSQV